MATSPPPPAPAAGTPADTATDTPPAAAASNPGGALSDLRGGLRLVVDSTQHITGLVEALHGQIQRLAPPLRRRPAAALDGDGLPPSRGLSRLVYRGIQAGTGLVGLGLDRLLASIDLASVAGHATPRRDALVAALNGVLGDHLQRSGNPLAIPFQLRQAGQPLPPDALGAAAGAAVGAAVGVASPGRVLLLIHGLCMGDGGWLRKGHDHGAQLGRALAAAPLYAHYNSGRHISDNGLALAQALQALLHTWPVPITELMLVGHSMGGLVARSALQQAGTLGHQWPQRVSKLVFLGTPHHGAPLERAGNWLHRLLGVSPYVAPFARLVRIRSDGITDLRHGNLLATDWQGANHLDHHDRRTPVPLPAGVVCYAIASTAGAPGTAKSLLGDGLVPLDSALGRHPRAAQRLRFAAGHTWVGHGIHHLDLLSAPAVYRKLLGWLAATTPA